MKQRKIGPKVLLVEDSNRDQELLVHELKKIDANVLVALTGMDGLELLRSGDFDALFLNLKLPDMPGLDVIRFARKIKPHVPLFVVTGLDDPRIRSQVFDAGAVVLWPKPYSSLENQQLLAMLAMHKAISNQNQLMRNPKTSWAGVVMIACGIAALVIPLFDGNPATNPTYELVIATIGGGYGLIQATDSFKLKKLVPTDGNNKQKVA